MRIEIDASNYAMEEVLSIKYADRRWRLVAYLLKLLNETKQNYEIHNKEIRELEVWRHLLKGTKFKFEIWKDHKNLEYFIKM